MNTRPFRTLRRVLFALALAAAVFTVARALDVPYLSGRVTDTAGMLSATVSTEIEALLKAYEDSSSNQIAVLIVSTLDGESLEDYSMKVAETWKLGRKGVDNGVLLLIAKDDRKLRIEVGYGLEASLTDAVTSYIINRVITPRFKQGDFDGGVREGVRAIISAADGTLDTSSASSSESSSGNDLTGWGLVFFLAFWFGIVGIFTMLALFSKGCMSWFLYAFLIPFYAGPAMILSATGAPWIGVAIFATYILGFPVLKVMFAQTEWGQSLQKKFEVKSASRGASGGFFSSGGSSSGWSSGGSSFSGGGGSFGGGGSSGSW